MTGLTIGKLAKICAVSTDTVRYYERVGVLLRPERTAAGYRVYARQSVQRLQFIRRAQSLGFTLEEIKELLTLHRLETTDCGDIKQRTEKKIDEIKQRIGDLRAMQRALEKLAAACKGKGAQLEECNILEYLYGEATCASH
ncbi:MAG: heavy metal-responsive transcriptional regulator [Alphaproteobacteria bacterium]|nr:heavy metal-responsive transcriptional regulator [Alphaproteobacteria bacterium]